MYSNIYVELGSQTLSKGMKRNIIVWLWLCKNGYSLIYNAQDKINGVFMKSTLEVDLVRQNSLLRKKQYLIPLNFRAPFIFAPLIYAHPQNFIFRAPLIFAHQIQFAPLLFSRTVNFQDFQ